jgi:exopolysaccharide biosynthesis WecB/TagA/CpsF family protein
MTRFGTGAGVSVAEAHRETAHRETSAAARVTAVRRIEVGGLPIAVIDRRDSARLFAYMARARRAEIALGVRRAPFYSTSANGQVVSLAARSTEMRDLFLSADLIHADGEPLVRVSRLLCTEPLPERVATTDFFHDMAKVAESEGLSFYMLGATPDMLLGALATVRRLYPGLHIAGAHHGYFDAREEAAVVADINRARPDILWIGMGVPAEQAFALRHRQALGRVGIIKTAGGLFDFLSGERRRAPPVMRRFALEWLWRLALEPRRLFWRYAVTNPHAALLLVLRSR